MGRRDDEDIFSLMGFPVNVMRKYSGRFSTHDVQLLHLSGISPETANKYHPRFNSSAIIGFNAWGISPVSPEVANGYSTAIPCEMVPTYYQMGITPNRVPATRQEKLLPVLNYVVNNLRGYSLLGSGVNAVVVNAYCGEEAGNVTYKVSLDMARELQVLEKIKGSHRSGADNIVKLRWVFQRSPLAVVALEYIPGKSLEDLVDRHGITDSWEASSYGGVLEHGNVRFSPDATLLYGAGIMRALSFLHSQGIHHRDLWLGNVLIHRSEQKAVLIDFDIATEDKTEPQPPNRNRRYGGENDFQSLGQMMYKMVTGHHIFNPTVHLSTHWIPDKIRRERERSYGDEGLLKRRLGMVDNNVSDPHLRNAIKTCLRARGDNPDKEAIRRSFFEVDSPKT